MDYRAHVLRTIPLIVLIYNSHVHVTHGQLSLADALTALDNENQLVDVVFVLDNTDIHGGWQQYYAHQKSLVYTLVRSVIDFAANRDTAKVGLLSFANNITDHVVPLTRNRSLVLDRLTHHACYLGTPAEATRRSGLIRDAICRAYRMIVDDQSQAPRRFVVVFTDLAAILPEFSGLVDEIHSQARDQQVSLLIVSPDGQPFDVRFHRHWQRRWTQHGYYTTQQWIQALSGSSEYDDIIELFIDNCSHINTTTLHSICSGAPPTRCPLTQVCGPSMGGVPPLMYDYKRSQGNMAVHVQRNCDHMNNCWTKANDPSCDGTSTASTPKTEESASRSTSKDKSSNSTIPLALGLVGGVAGIVVVTIVVIVIFAKRRRKQQEQDYMYNDTPTYNGTLSGMTPAPEPPKYYQHNRVDNPEPVYANTLNSEAALSDQQEEVYENFTPQRRSPPSAQELEDEQQIYQNELPESQGMDSWKLFLLNAVPYGLKQVLICNRPCTMWAKSVRMRLDGDDVRKAYEILATAKQYTPAHILVQSEMYEVVSRNKDILVAERKSEQNTLTACIGRSRRFAIIAVSDGQQNVKLFKREVTRLTRYLKKVGH